MASKKDIELQLEFMRWVLKQTGDSPFQTIRWALAEAVAANAEQAAEGTLPPDALKRWNEAQRLLKELP